MRKSTKGSGQFFTNNLLRTSDSNFFESLEARSLLSVVGVFQDDVMEPNNTRRQVEAALPSHTQSPNLGEVEGTVVINRLKLLDGRDTFRIVLSETGGPNDYAQINFKNFAGNLDLRLLDTDGITLYRTKGNSNREILSFDGVPEGEYFIQVVGRRGATNTNYKLTVNVDVKRNSDYEFDDLGPRSMELSVGTPLLEDAYEYGNDSIIAVKQQEAGGVNSPNLGMVKESFTLSRLYLSDSKDIYRLDLSGDFFQNGYVKVKSDEPMNLALFDSSGHAVAFADAYFGDDTIDLTNFAGGEVFIMVTHYAYENPVNVEYSLEFSVNN